MKNTFILAVVAMLSVSSCQPDQHKSIEQDIVIQSGMVNTEETELQEPVSKDWEKQIIKRASLELEVEDFKHTADTIRDLVQQAGGYIANDNQYHYSYRLQSDVSIRVPREKFDWLVDALIVKGDKVVKRNIETEDVTAEYVDIEARVAAREKLRDKYYDFLKKASNVEEALKVQKEIGGLQENIEVVSGRMAYLKHQSQYSTINLSYFQSLDDAGERNSFGFLKKTGSAFVEGWYGLQILIVGFVSIWPIWSTAIVLFVGFRRLSKQMKT